MKIYNCNLHLKEDFIPLHDGVVNMYSCGPTVYNFFHIGNARPFIIFDTLRRFFEYRNYKVNFVQNFTDVDDKMIKAAANEGLTVKELGDKFIAEYFKDAEALNIKKATVHPKATEHIPEIIELIKKLIDSGHAYVSSNDVYFDVLSDPGYGKLTGQDLSDLLAGARIDVNEIKRHPYDFALWKGKKDNEISWDSPWGEGRPGWHIECSAMSMKYLGETIDIHGGGQDLKFPHHTNEIAQSENATGKQFVRYWMHNGYINIDNKKMSKSAGNFFTVRDLLEKYEPLALRLFMLNSHYANPINFSDELLKQSQAAYSRILNCREGLIHIIESCGTDLCSVNPVQITERIKTDFIAELEDDFNTAGAIGKVFDLVRESNTIIDCCHDSETARKLLDCLDEMLDVLGLIKTNENNSIPDEVLELSEKRTEARNSKDYALADELRNRIAEIGYAVKDTKDGVIISKI